MLLCELAVIEAFACGIACVDRLDGLDGLVRVDVTRTLAERGALWVAAAWGLAEDPDLDALAEALEVSLVWVEDGNARLIPAAAGEAAA